MDFLSFLADLRNPVGDFFFLLTTNLGHEVFFMIVALAVLWCGKRHHGYYILVSGFLGIICNQVLKLLCRVPRPWVLDPKFEAVEAAKPAATGYSFPSGHTQSATTLYGGVARAYKHTALRIACIAAVVIVSFSRMYLGVHTPADVLTSLAIGTVIVFLLYPLFERVGKNMRLMYPIALALCALAFGYVLFVELFPFPADMDPLHYADGAKNAYSLLGAAVAILPVLYLDEHYIRYDSHASMLWQFVKVAVGLLLLLGIKEGCKMPLDLIFGDLAVKHAVRYFLMVLVGGALYPYFFRFIPKKK